MNQDSVDPRQERMIAALYGELSPEAEEAFRAELDEDAALRSEFAELMETRGVLESWEVEDPSAGFLLAPDETRPAPGFGARLRTWFRAPMPAWGFALSTAALAVLLVAGFRVDRVPGGVAFRFGPGEPALQAAGPLEPAGSPIPGMEVPAAGSMNARPVSTAAPVTRRDLDLYAGGLMEAMSSMLDTYQDKRNTELAYILQNFYENMRYEREKDVSELKAQMQGVGLGLMAEQSMTQAAIMDLMKQSAGRPGFQDPIPLEPYDTPRNQTEDDQ